MFKKAGGLEVYVSTITGIDMPKICKICLNNDILCQACDNALKTGRITKADVDLSRAVHKLGINADFLKSADSGLLYILADRKDARILIGREGRNSRKLEAALKRKLRIIEKRDEKDIIEKVLGTDIIGVNVLYTPKERYRIRVQKIFRNRVKPDSVAALKDLLGKDYEVVFE